MKKYLIIIFISLVGALLVLLLFDLFSKKPPISSPEEIPTPTLSTKETQSNNKRGPLKILSVSPETKYLQSLTMVSPIIIEFDNPIVPTSLDYDIVPKTELLLELDSTATKLSFKPKQSWKPNQPYVLTIKKAKGQNGSILQTEYKVSFKSIVVADE